MKKILFTLLISLFFISGVNAAENETFYSKTLLGRFANGDWQPVVALTSQTNELILAQLGQSDYYDVYPIWMGFYGSATYGFTTDKIYNLSFRVDYSSSGNRFFDWKKAMQYAQMEIVIENAVVSYCTMNANTNSYSEFTCEFKVSQNSGSYYEINVNWWNTNLSQLGFNGIYPEYGMVLKFDLTMTSNTDYGGQIVSQNEIIIGQNQQIIDSNNATNDKLDDLQDSITDSSVSNDTANSFFEGFESDDYGLSDIITMPLDLIRGLTNNTCVALKLTLPFVNKTFELPCMSSIYSQYFGSFFNLYQTITFGFVAYWVIVKIFALVKGFKDPDDDKVEVLDL